MAWNETTVKQKPRPKNGKMQKGTLKKGMFVQNHQGFIEHLAGAAPCDIELVEQESGDQFEIITVRIYYKA
jgi:hypothetical protein